jgi:hypothetical protein
MELLLMSSNQSAAGPRKDPVWKGQPAVPDRHCKGHHHRHRVRSFRATRHRDRRWVPNGIFLGLRGRDARAQSPSLSLRCSFHTPSPFQSALIFSLPDFSGRVAVTQTAPSIFSCRDVPSPVLAFWSSTAHFSKEAQHRQGREPRGLASTASCRKPSEPAVPLSCTLLTDLCLQARRSSRATTL